MCRMNDVLSRIIIIDQTCVEIEIKLVFRTFCQTAKYQQNCYLWRVIFSVSAMKLSDRINAKVQIRNRDLVPHLENEGCFWRPLPMPRHTDEASQPSSISMISTHKRLFYHQTLNSARKTVHYQPYEDVIPQDSLDFALASIYDDKRQLHASKADVLVQMETAGFQTARRLRNTIDIIPEFEPDLGHPLIIGE